ncbi:aldo/keto reductase [Streptomyces sp. GbtcB6]|uniref:aldo/keto reductase n=1 Tax=Streptomyces sp. GbtcB6 TaxID=2824751 RepID=UPI0020C63209|nr:aldo/keto reductase [Streptomyces sp. GbtcB6]
MATDAMAAGVISIAGRTVPRMGFGAMQLRGSIRPEDALAVLSRAVELGVRVIDTAWYYGSDVVNRFIAEALRPYPADLVLATKAGARANHSGNPPQPDYRPGQLRAGNDRDRTVLGLDTVPLTHLRWLGPDDAYGGVTFDSAFETMLAMQAEGRIEHVGLSNVTLGQLRRAHARGPVASVSNMFGYGRQGDAPTLEFCTENGIPYLPFGPLGYGAADTPPAGPGQTAAQARLAWLLARSPATVVIAGTSSVKHLEENIAAGAQRNPV